MPCGDKLSEASRADTNSIIMRTTEGDFAKIRHPNMGCHIHKEQASFEPIWVGNEPLKG
jgi:hypothetical protein